ncbi:MAG: LysM peptidoglycan-binding domain-containing protein [Planctomycetaceae bacterium]|nr:LysM peptidoglycan-binding domain-containing protein [Planctomycetaceae bacterium]
MHRDTKLGLAFGMLVLGFAAAFCFPRQPVSTNSSGAKSEPQMVDLVPIHSHGVSPPDAIEQVADVSIPSREVNESVEHVELPLEVRTPEPVATGQPATTEVLPEMGSGPPVAQSPEVERTNTVQTHVVSAGDTLSGIALKHFGNSQRFYDVFLANRDKLSTPDDLLKIGMVLKLPSQPVDEEPPLEANDSVANASNSTIEKEPEPTLVLPKRYVVREGDTLLKIARRYYGDDQRAKEIEVANPKAVESGVLRIGATLELPPVR